MLKVTERLLVAGMGAAPCWCMAILFFRTWQTPMAIENGRWVKLAVGIMVLEFILVHSGAFLGKLAQRTDKTGLPCDKTRQFALLAGLCCFYLMFAVAISLSLQSWMLFYMFCWVSGSRLFSWFLDMRKKDNVTMARSGVSILLYLSAMLLSVFVQFPAAGITTEVLDKVYPGRGSGLWERSPQQALLAGMFYFGILGLWEFAAPLKGDHRGQGDDRCQPSTLDI